MGQRIAIMNEGELQQYAPPLEVYRRPTNTFVARFIGSPAINFFRGRLGESDGAWTFSSEAFDLIVPDSGVGYTGEAVLGARPEDIRLSDTGGLRAVIRVVEPVGSEIYVHLDTADGQRVIIRAPADASAAVDDRVALDIPPGKVHLFRADTGQRVGP